MTFDRDSREYKYMEVIARLSERVRLLEQREVSELVLSTDNVSNPPTDAELDTAFGTAANLPEGFIGKVDDNGAGTTVWLVTVTNSAWWYVQMTKAV